MHLRINYKTVSRRRAAFSLVELVIVAALIFVLFTVYWSRGSASYQRKQMAACRNNLQTAYLALEGYAADHNEKYPVLTEAKTSEAPLSLLIPQYTARTELFICPGSKDSALPSAEPFHTRRISYAYLMGITSKAPGEQWLLSDRQVNTLPKEKGAQVFSLDGKAPGNNHDKYGGVILFAGGNAELTRSRTDYAITNPAGTAMLNPR
jgi:type II secretory pathway pseudopilin PulG